MKSRRRTRLRVLRWNHMVTGQCVPEIDSQTISSPATSTSFAITATKTRSAHDRSHGDVCLAPDRRDAGSSNDPLGRGFVIDKAYEGYNPQRYHVSSSGTTRLFSVPATHDLNIKPRRRFDSRDASPNAFPAAGLVTSAVGRR